MNDKLKIAILFGGCSSEHSISLKSAYAVISHLNREKYEPILIGITPSGEWFRYYGDPANIQNNTWIDSSDCVRAIISPSRDVQGLLEFEFGEIRTVRLDAAMPILHGENGEDGTIQGLLELAGIPVVGCGTLCSALCMDKDKAHKIAHAAGVRVPQSYVITRPSFAPAVDALANQENTATDYMKLTEALGYPVFVKPVRGGSSIGITKVARSDDLSAAAALAFEHSDEVIVEEAIDGFEVGCAVMGNGGAEDLIVGEVDEIALADGFFDFKEKYTLETSAIHVPARIPSGKAEEIKTTAKILYRALGCQGFARVDMFLTSDGEIIFNEVNTIPGFTAHSRFPNMLKAAGMTFEEIIDTAIGLAVGSDAGSAADTVPSSGTNIGTTDRLMASAAAACIQPGIGDESFSFLSRPGMGAVGQILNFGGGV